MKTIITKNLIVLCLISLMLALGACSKYEDGPWISFRSPQKRIMGKWEVKYFEKNKTDLTSLWKQNYNWSFFFYDEIIQIFDCKCIIDTSYSDVGSFGTWMFGNQSHNQLTFSFFFISLDSLNEHVCDGIGLFPIISGQRIYFDILKLTNSKLWLEQTDSLGNEYLIKLDKILEYEGL